MSHKLSKLLLDMQMAIGLIQDFIGDVDHDAFVLDPLLKSAVQMQFIAIGKALVRMHAAFPEDFARISDARRIIDFRNILAHGYDMISDDLVWDVLENHLGILAKEVQHLMERDGST